MSSRSLYAEAIIASFIVAVMKRHGGGNSASIRSQQLGRCGFKRIRSVLTNWPMLPQIVWGSRGPLPRVSVRPA